MDWLDIDDIMLIGPDEQEVTSSLETFVTHAFRRVGEKPYEDSEVSHVSNVFRGLVVWGMLRHPPSKVKDILVALAFPTTKKEIQHLLSLFEFHRQHIPNLGISLQPIYQVT